MNIDMTAATGAPRAKAIPVTRASIRVPTAAGRQPCPEQRDPGTADDDGDERDVDRHARRQRGDDGDRHVQEAGQQRTAPREPDRPEASCRWRRVATPATTDCRGPCGQPRHQRPVPGGVRPGVRWPRRWTSGASCWRPSAPSGGSSIGSTPRRRTRGPTEVRRSCTCGPRVPATTRAAGWASKRRSVGDAAAEIRRVR